MRIRQSGVTVGILLSKDLGALIVLQQTAIKVIDSRKTTNHYTAGVASLAIETNQ